MKDRRFYLYWVLAIASSVLLSAYPLYMGIRVVGDMLRAGTVMAENYPKYVIPYTPISVAVLFAVLLMPILLKHLRRYATVAASALGASVFLAAELILEKWVVVKETVSLESWQMYMCYVSPKVCKTREWTPIDVLIGEYSPSFKLHFYFISLILIVAFVALFYGFGSAILKGEYGRIRQLFVLSVLTAAFLALCILACMTAFFRDGELTVSPLSAILMAVFFIVMGLCAGAVASLFLPGKRLLCGAISGVTVLIMYIGEMCLLHGNLYRFGSGFLFDGLGFLVLAPLDILIIAVSVALSAVCCMGRRR